MMVTLASSNTLLQTITDEDKRGRVMSLYTMAFLGVVPFGSLLSGWLTNHVGVLPTVFGGGLALLVADGSQKETADARVGGGGSGLGDRRLATRFFLGF